VTSIVKEKLLLTAFAYAGLLAVGLVTALVSPKSAGIALTLRPIIHASEEERYEAMRSAPVIVIGQLGNLQVIGFTPKVPKPSGIGGPNIPSIPMYLIQQTARVLATLRGEGRDTVEFYYWTYAIGKHGGPRLFNASPGSGHVLFLKEEGGLLRIVGDYPAYDLEITRGFVAEFSSEADSEFDLFERIVAAHIRTHLKARVLDERYISGGIFEWIKLTSPFFVVSALDTYCRSFPHPPGQIAACTMTAVEFPGRCEGFRRAIELGSDNWLLKRWVAQCKADLTGQINAFRREGWPLLTYGWGQTAERHRLAMRLYASATEPPFHDAACEAAAAMPEARDIPECATPPER
jgi:hypothetical protein